MTTPSTSTPPTPSSRVGALNALLTRWADLANPILVRTLRQEMRSKVFLATYGLALLLACSVAVGVCMLSGDLGRGVAGYQLFVICCGAWAVASWLIAGMSAFNALARERNDDTWDLVELTGMGPRRVVMGVWKTALVQNAIYGAALTPFLTLGYVLRGVDIGLAIVALIGVPLIGSAVTAIAVLFGASGATKASRSGLAGLCALGLLGICAPGIAGISHGDELWQMMAENNSAAWIFPLFFASAWLIIVVLSLVLATGRLHHRAADRSTWPRLVAVGIPLYVIVFVLTAMGIVWLSEPRSSSMRSEWTIPLVFVGFATQIWAILVGLCAITEPWSMSARQARAITAAPRWRRWLTGISGPGAARGRLCYLLIVGIGIACTLPMWIAGGLDGYLSNRLIPVAVASYAIAAYGAIFLYLGDALCRWLFPRLLGAPDARRVAILAASAVYIGLSAIVIGLLGGFSRSSYQSWEELWMTVSPLVGLSHLMDYRHDTDVYAGSLFIIPVILIGIVAMVVMFVQGLRMRVQTMAVRAEDGDRNPRG